jgi:DNA-binding ferritin-like protein (Dps family)
VVVAVVLTGHGQVAILQKVAESYDKATQKGEDALKMGSDDVACLVDQLLRAEKGESKSSASSRPSYFHDFKRGLKASLRVFEKVGKEADLDAVLLELVSTPDYVEVGKLAAELEPLVHDLAERWRAVQR